MNPRDAMSWLQRQSTITLTPASWLWMSSRIGPHSKLLWRMWTSPLSSYRQSTNGTFLKMQLWERWSAASVPETLTQTTIPSGNVSCQKTEKMPSAIQRTTTSMIMTRKKPKLAWVEHPLTASSTGWKIIPFQIVLLPRCIRFYPWSLDIPYMVIFISYYFSGKWALLNKSWQFFLTPHGLFYLLAWYYHKATLPGRVNVIKHHTRWHMELRFAVICKWGTLQRRQPYNWVPVVHLSRA